VQVNFIAKSWSFTQNGFTMPDQTLGPANPAGSIDVTFVNVPSGFTIDPASVQDSAPEFTLNVTSPTSGVTVKLRDDVVPTAVVNQANSWRYGVVYSVDPSVAPGTKVGLNTVFDGSKLSFISNSNDDHAYTPLHPFVLTSPASTNHRSYIDVA